MKNEPKPVHCKKIQFLGDFVLVLVCKPSKAQAKLTKKHKAEKYVKKKKKELQ